jgi:streptogramin lyase
VAGSTARARARFRLEGLEQRHLLSGVSGYTEYPIPSGNGSGYITSGLNGNLWFTEDLSGFGMIDPTTHAITEFATAANSRPREITTGPDGNIWFTELTGETLVRVNPTTDNVTDFTIPGGVGPWGITAGPDGNIWFTEYSGNAIGMFNLSTHAVSSFATPTPNSTPEGITVGPDGNLWFVERGADKIGEINPTTHVVSEFPLPISGLNPTDIAVGSDGNLWFTVPGSSSGSDGTWVGMINPTTHVVGLLPTAYVPSGITSGPDGNIWFSGSQIGVVNVSTDAVTEFPVPANDSGITTGPDGNLWFTAGSNIGVATLSSTEADLAVTQQPPTSVVAGSGFGLTVQAEDGSGNLITSFNGTVTVTLAANPGGATLGGTLSVQASGGVATFSGLTLTEAGAGYTMVATSGMSGEGFTGAVTVTPAAPTQVVITSEPPSMVKLNTAFSLTASIEDAYGNVVTTASNIVRVALGANPTGATLGGTLSAAARDGVATFSNLTINAVGNGYTIKVSSTSLASAITTGIDVTKTGKSASAAVITAVDPLMGSLVFDSPDFFDTLGIKKQPTV